MLFQFVFNNLRIPCVIHARRSAGAFVVLGLMIATGLSNPAFAVSDRALIRGFNLTVFGAEYSPFGIQSRYIRKFNGPVKFRIHNLSKKNRINQVSRFIKGLNKKISGLTTRVVGASGRADFNVYVVDQIDYEKTARSKVYRRTGAQVPGRCLVRSVFSRNGILRSDAVIVSDDGEALFQRCLVEEILQGLGPLNEHSSLSQSMFNDRSKHTKFTKFDRYILNMLYDRRVKNGASPRSVNAVLPLVLKDVRKRLK